MDEKERTRRIVNKKNTKLTHGKRLSHPNSYKGVRAELVKSGDTETLAHQRGRKSVEEIAREKGKFDDITDALADFVIQNPFYNQRELMEFCMSRFGEVFKTSKTKYPQNFYKLLERVDQWREALSCSIVDPKRAILRNLHQRAIKGIREEIDTNGKVYEVGMKDKDAMEYIRLLHDVEVWEQEKNVVGQNNSEETINTLNEIEQGLKELGGEENV